MLNNFLFYRNQMGKVDRKGYLQFVQTRQFVKNIDGQSGKIVFV